MTLDPKIRPDHFRRAAVVYVRQSTLHQVRGNRESGARQYALVDRAKALGWPATAVQTIDEDQGRSGAHADQRQGFKKLKDSRSSWPRSAPDRLGWCWHSKPPGWHARLSIGTGSSRSAS